MVIRLLVRLFFERTHIKGPGLCNNLSKLDGCFSYILYLQNFLVMTSSSHSYIVR